VSNPTGEYFDSDATGRRVAAQPTQEVRYPFDRYIVTVVLDSAQRFIGIKEIAINKDFMDYRQKGRLKGLPDADKFYQKDEET